MAQQTPIEILSFSTTPDEAQQLRQQASDTGDTLSAYLRSLVFGPEVADKPLESSPSVATLRIELVDGRA
jgi:hypothetical protein